MPLNCSINVKWAVLVAVASVALTAHGQDGPAIGSDSTPTGTLESKQWSEMRNEFQAWLSVQQIYTAEEVTAIVNELNDRALTMSESERTELLGDMQERLRVLMSPQAEEARLWISQFRTTAQNSEQRLRSKRPDVMNMTAQQIREELSGFQRQRTVDHQAQTAFERTRALQAEAALGIQAQRRQAQQQVSDVRGRAAANAQVRSPYAPRPQDLPNHTDFDEVARSQSRIPYHTISPWGTPMRWHPFYDYWW